MTDRRDVGQPSACRDQRLGTCRTGRCGQHGVEGAKARSFLIQAQPFAQVGFLDDKEGRQQLEVVAG
jgi:hypothetical protein